jgi:biotin carboxyl carrier protein
MNTSANPVSVSSPEEAGKPQKSFGGRWALGIVVLTLAFVVMPFLFWNATWFGRPLTDAQVSKVLADRTHPREIQHVLSQFEMRIEKGDSSVHLWYPQIVTLAKDPIDEIRVTDAWVMGQDNTSPEFHAALIGMLADPNPMVQRNAALSLVRFKDDSGHAQIVAMLRPYVMPSPLAGVIATRLKPGDVVNPGTLVAHIEAVGTTKGKNDEVRANTPGTVDHWLVANGATVTVGEPIVLLAPSESMIWESLRALFLTGRPEDLPDVNRFLRGADGISPQIATQAQATAKSIRDRATQQPINQ